MTYYKVVRYDLTSLKLLIKGKPFAPVQYKIGKWCYPSSQKGGLFVCRKLCGVVWLLRYISNKKKTIEERTLEFSQKARVFEAEVGSEIGKKQSKFMSEVDRVKLVREIEVKPW